MASAARGSTRRRRRRDAAARRRDDGLGARRRRRRRRSRPPRRRRRRRRGPRPGAAARVSRSASGPSAPRPGSRSPHSRQYSWPARDGAPQRGHARPRSSLTRRCPRRRRRRRARARSSGRSARRSGAARRTCRSRAGAGASPAPADERVDLRDARLDRDELGAALDDERLVELVAAVHLEREAAEVAQPVLAEQEQRAALAPQVARGGRGRLALEERQRPDEDTRRRPRRRYSWTTTSRSSVISRTAHAGPSRVLPESLTPPYGIWSARNVGASLTVTPPNSRRPRASSAARRLDVKMPAWRPYRVAFASVDRLVERVVRLHRADRAERLVARELRVGRRRLDDRRAEQVALERRRR